MGMVVKFDNIKCWQRYWASKTLPQCKRQFITIPSRFISIPQKKLSLVGMRKPYTRIFLFKWCVIVKKIINKIPTFRLWINSLQYIISELLLITKNSQTMNVQGSKEGMMLGKFPSHTQRLKNSEVWKILNFARLIWWSYKRYCIFHQNCCDD